MKKIRVGIVGANAERGWAKVAHVPALRALPQFEITAVSTRNRASAEQAAALFGAAHAFDRVEALVAHPEVDVVTVSVKTPDHAAVVRAAIEAGKHVFCEWPLGASTIEAEELAGLAKARGVRTAIGLQRRYLPSILHVRELIAEGYVGRLRSCNFSYPIPMMGTRTPIQNAYSTDAKNGATLLSIMGGHFFDLVCFALGDLREVAAVVARQFETTTLLETGEVIPVNTPHQVLVSGTFASNAVLSAHLEAGRQQGPSHLTMHITGTEGSLELRSDTHDPTDLLLFGARGDEPHLEKLTVPQAHVGEYGTDLQGSAYAMTQLYAAFGRDIADGTSLAPGFDDALRRHRLLDAIQTAASTGRTQPVPG
ncbi:Gfo/Idh/MocA family protein [Pendulispora albinea]|uniref:Gfo/Idh/MocA family oxidoreductase n=1 Tax=Pendulispora albinea TaxID=2741071 RepID=A0ABZ2LQ37_9BACT